MKTICGADCRKCPFREECRGCAETCGRPFGGTCVAAEYIKAGGLEKYREFKQVLLGEVNTLLEANGIPPADGLQELAGFYVNLPYPLPSGRAVKKKGLWCFALPTGAFIGPNSCMVSSTSRMSSPPFQATSILYYVKVNTKHRELQDWNEN